MARESKTRKDGRIHVTWGEEGSQQGRCRRRVRKGSGEDGQNSGIHLLKRHNKIHYFVCQFQKLVKRMWLR